MGLTEITLDLSFVDNLIKNALEEDIKTGDLSTDLLIPDDKLAKARMIAKADGVIAGLWVAEKVFQILDPEMIWKSIKQDGDLVVSGNVIAEFTGSYRAILTGERTALNFLQRMSGIATKTAKFVEAVKEYKTEILDTRKTLPGFRMLDKYSVAVGGGTNHRVGLYDMVMLKENHIRIAGGIKKAVEQIRLRLRSGILIEVETTNLEEVNEAIEAAVDIIMLDNMSNIEMSQAVNAVNGRAKIEASGSMNLDRVKEVASLGVDYISVGSLTHSVEALDISQQIVV